MDNNVYVITSKRTGTQVLIDAAADPGAIVRLLAEGAADAQAADAQAEGGLGLIVTTHSHSDHVGALAALVAATGAPTAAGREDDDEIARQTGVRADRLLAHGEEATAGDIALGVVALRGHTPGSVALVLAEDGQPARLFTGDSLFPGGVGNTDGDPARFASLFADVTTRLFGVYGDDAAVLPGHGAATTLGAERPALAKWEARGW
jgi:glyoxylase-like metal-dependent hydrolase (beta-lactamase superfamily II)